MCLWLNSVGVSGQMFTAPERKLVPTFVRVFWLRNHGIQCIQSFKSIYRHFAVLQDARPPKVPPLSECLEVSARSTSSPCSRSNSMDNESLKWALFTLCCAIIAKITHSNLSHVQQAVSSIIRGVSPFGRRRQSEQPPNSSQIAVLASGPPLQITSRDRLSTV